MGRLSGAQLLHSQLIDSNDKAVFVTKHVHGFRVHSPAGAARQIGESLVFHAPSVAVHVFPRGSEPRGAAVVTEPPGPLTRHAGKLPVVACGRSWRLGPASRGTQALGSPPHLGLELRPHGACRTGQCQPTGPGSCVAVCPLTVRPPWLFFNVAHGGRATSGWAGPGPKLRGPGLTECQCPLKLHREGAPIRFELASPLTAEHPRDRCRS